MAHFWDPAAMNRMTGKTKGSYRATTRQAWLLLGTAAAVTAVIALLLSAPAAVSHAAASAASAGLSSQAPLFWAVVAVVVLFAVATLLGVMLQSALLSRRRALALVARVSKALREAEAAQRAVTDCSTEGIITVDAGSNVLSFNRAAERMFGFKAAEVVGRHVDMLVPQRHRHGYGRSLSDMDDLGWGEQAGTRHEVTGLRRDGKEFPLLLALNAVDLSGPRRFVGVISDLSERKKAEQALHESELHLRLMLTSINDYAILMLDPQGRVLQWNRSAERLNGCESEEMLGKHYAGLCADEYSESDAPRALEQAATAGRSESRTWRRRRDGSRFQAHEVINAVRDNEGRLLGYCSIIRDGTQEASVLPSQQERGSHAESLC